MDNEERILSQIMGYKGTIIFDLKKVSYIASTFIRLLCSAAVIVGKDNFTILNVNGENRKILKKLGMFSTLGIK